MRKIQKPLAVLLFALLAVISCKRETIRKDSNPTPEEGKTVAPSKVVYRATQEQVNTAKAQWLREARASRSNIAARGGCGEHIKHQVMILSISNGSCGSSTSWDIEYLFWSYDYVGSGYVSAPISATFTDNSSNTLSASLVSSTATLVDPSCTNWWADGYCEMTRDNIYLLSSVPTSTASNWPVDLGNYSLGLRSGFAGNCTPLTTAGDLKGSFTAAEYAAMPARIYPNPTGATGALFVTTDCSTLCPPGYTVCPTGGSFTYWPQGSPGSAVTISLSTIGNLITSISPAGLYDYSGTLNYTIGGNSFTTPPKTGTVNIP